MLATDNKEREPYPERPRPRVRLFGKTITLPQSRAVRVSFGGGLIVGGFLGFLPVLGFWMVPLGLLVLAYDFPAARRLNRRAAVWWGRRRQR